MFVTLLEQWMWGGWLSDIGSLGRPWIGREHKERPMGSKVAKGWFWRREMILSEWRRKGHNTRRSWHPEHKWGDPIEMVELGSENDWVASERLTRNESGNRTMHYSTSSPRRWMQACFKFIASVHFNALLQPRLHRPLFLAPPPPPPPPLPPPPVSGHSTSRHLTRDPLGVPWSDVCFL